jgi:Cu+-exporting ATPase
MLFAIAGYLGLDSASGPAFRQMTGWISLALSVPVVAYCARDYWAAAWLGLRRRMAVIEIPIAVGIAALFGRSVYDFLSGRGEGYFDSLAGLLFFLLCGKAFQQRVHERLVFDRDYRSFFPLAVTRRRDGREERAALSRLSVGDRLVIRHGEIIPADARLVAGGALIDYAFVTGESCPVARSAGDLLYAGGRQTAGAIEIDTVKPVSQGYLASLWDQEAFRKEKPDAMDRITNAYSRRFTRIILGIAGGAAAWWWASGDPKRGIDAFVSVLIVACPCALALAAPFTLGTAQRVLASCGVHLKNPFVAETLSRVDAVVFDKTGTLTRPGAAAAWHGRPLAPDEREAVAALAACSTHPLAARIATPVAGSRRPVVGAFRETPGSGLEGDVSGRRILLGSAAWLRANGVATPSSPAKDASGPVHVALDGAYRGAFVGESALRPDAERIPGMLAGRCDLALLSGDDDHERARFEALFGGRAELRFRQTPADKLEFVDRLQRGGRTVLMFGDGLNDAGALRRGDVGVAVVEDVGAFSPASDVILAAEMVPRLPEILRFARGSVRLVRAGFLVSGVYNVAGIAIAAAGLLSPVVCAVLMPLSSVSVVAFACLATRRLGRRVFGRAGEEPA